MSPIQAVTDPAELALAADIRNRLGLIPPLLEASERFQKAKGQERSQSAADDRATAWMQLSHTVSHCMFMAADNLRALCTLMMPDGEGLTTYAFAHYPLLRAAFEASSHALWLVSPETQRERIQRLLQTRAAETGYDFSLNKTLRKVGPNAPKDQQRLATEAAKIGDARHAKHMNKIREIADASAIGHDDFVRLPGYGDIVAIAAEAADLNGSYATTVWQVLSGLSHPSTSRAVNFSALEPISESVDGVTHNLLTADLRWVQAGLLASLAHYRMADSLIRARMITPANGV